MSGKVVVGGVKLDPAEQSRAASREAKPGSNTLIIVTSDNGTPTIFSDGGDLTRHRPNGDWLGRKGDPRDEHPTAAGLYAKPQRICAGETGGLPFGVPL